jgi:predicted nucleic acid-binding protein
MSKMNVYLLDTCIWSYWFNGQTLEHEGVVRNANALNSGCILAMSAITLGEIEFGWQWAGSTKGNSSLAYQKFVDSKSPQVLRIDRHTAREYGRLKALLCEQYMPKSERGKACRLRQLVDPATSESLGIDENDLWIVAQAIERNLVLITNDKLMRIRKVAGDALHVENWTQ